MSEQAKRKYDATVARIAGNLLSNTFDFNETPRDGDIQSATATAVAIARAIVAEVERTEPKQESK